MGKSIDKKEAEVTSLVVSEQEMAGSDVSLSVNLPSQVLSQDDLVGSIIGGHYELTEKLGSGAGGVVYKAKQVYLDKFVAIKLMALQRQLDDKALQRFQREAQAASLVDHINLVRVLEFGLHNEQTPYLVMELVEGTPLSKLLASKGKMSTLRATEIGLQICAALIHAHKKGVLHRDIKPSNVIITIDDQGNELAKVVDFGIAKLLRRDGLASATLTATGEIIGTPLYMSPEQCTGQELDERSDIYSVGCLLYEMVTGKHAVIADSALGAMMVHVNELKPDFESVTVLPYFKTVIEKCLKRDREMRFSSMTLLSKALARSSQEDFLARLAKMDLTLEQNQSLNMFNKALSTGFRSYLVFTAGVIVGAAIITGVAYWALTAAGHERAEWRRERSDWQTAMVHARKATENKSYAEALKYYEAAKDAALFENNRQRLIETLDDEGSLLKSYPVPAAAGQDQKSGKD